MQAEGVEQTCRMACGCYRTENCGVHAHPSPFLAREDCGNCGGDGHHRRWYEDWDERGNGAWIQVQCQACLDSLSEDALSRCSEHPSNGCGCRDCATVDMVIAIEARLRGDL